MSSLQKDPSGNFHICFRFQGKRFKRSLKTKLEKKAAAALAKLDERLWLISGGHLNVPENVELAQFLIFGEVRLPSSKSPSPKSLSLEKLFDEYFITAKNGSLDQSTIGTLNIHRRHLERELGKKTKASQIKPSCLQGYINKRAKSKGKFGRPLCGSTIKKELVTLRTIWNWAFEMELVEFKLTLKKLRFPKSFELLPFQTRAQIEKQIASGGCSSIRERELWESLFLLKHEIQEVLETIKQNATARFLYPMVAIAAFTGARRSELLRMKVADVLDGRLLLRERKRLRGEFSTRLVPISNSLKPVLAKWLEDRPKGEMLFLTEFSKPVTKNSAHKRLKTALRNSRWSCVKGYHVFRHSFISALAIEGIDQRIIDEIVGHSTDQQRQRYRHLTPELASNAVDHVFG